MVKYFLLSLMVMTTAACSAHDEDYYRTHPHELEKALKNCSLQPSETMSCGQLKLIANDVNELAYSLQVNPQGFGSKIISLQNQLAVKQAELARNPKQTELNESILSLQKELNNRLAIVKWLESPES